METHFFRIVATVSPPFQTYLEDGCNSSKCFKGVYADTFHKLAETMNFTFTIEWVKAFGGIKNGSWTGMIGMEARHKFWPINDNLISFRVSIIQYF